MDICIFTIDTLKAVINVMFRKDTWENEFYIDNHDNYQCLECNKQFIVGRELLKLANREQPICPYCGSHITECGSCTEDDMLEELANDLGCLGIYIDLS